MCWPWSSTISRSTTRRPTKPPTLRHSRRRSTWLRLLSWRFPARSVRLSLQYSTAHFHQPSSRHSRRRLSPICLHSRWVPSLFSRRSTKIANFFRLFESRHLCGGRASLPTTPECGLQVHAIRIGRTHLRRTFRWSCGTLRDTALIHFNKIHFPWIYFSSSSPLALALGSNWKINEIKILTTDSSEHESNGWGNFSSLIRHFQTVFLSFWVECASIFYILARFSRAVIKIDTSPVSALISLFSAFVKVFAEVFEAGSTIIRIFPFALNHFNEASRRISPKPAGDSREKRPIRQ